MVIDPEGYKEYNEFRNNLSGRFKEIPPSDTISEERIKYLKDSLPAIESELDTLIYELEIFLKNNFNPIDVLTVFAFECSTSIDIYCSIVDSTLELLQTILLRNEFREYPEKSSLDELDNLSEKLTYIEFLIRDWAFSKSLQFTLNQEQQFTLFQIIAKYVTVRGEIYPAHVIDVIPELFGKFENIFKTKGFTPNDYLTFVNDVRDQLEINFKNIFINSTELSRKLSEFPLKGVDDLRVMHNLRKYICSTDGRRTFRELIKNNNFRQIFKLNIKLLNKQLLDLNVCNFGNSEPWNGPLGSLFIKPIIRLGKDYYCFLPTHLSWFAIEFLESFLKNNEAYYMQRGEYFEKKVHQAFTKVLKDAKIYPNIFYPINNGEWAECDGIAIFKRLLILYEIKGKNRRSILGKSDIIKLTEQDIKKNIIKTFEQTKRVLTYINQNEMVKFYDSPNGKQILEFKKENFKSIFPFIITSNSFEEFTTNLSKLKDFGLDFEQEGIWPLAISIYDLLTVTEILDSPIDFIDYITQRLAFNRGLNIFAWDEMDLLGYFLECGDLIDEHVDKSRILLGYSSALDEYYTSKYHGRPFQKPFRKLSYKKRLERGYIGKNHPCWCDSGKKYKLCHKNAE